MSDDSTTVTPQTRLALRNRSHGRCEWCGHGGKRLEVHHRLYRSRGGGHDASNLVMLCGWGNHTGCHGRAHGAEPGDTDAAIRAGMTLPSGADPEAVEIRSVVFGIPMWLLPNGDVVFDRPAPIDPAAVPRLR